MAKDHGATVAEQHGIRRSPKWPGVERAFRKLYPRCAVCGKTESVQIHHQFPFHDVILAGRPDLELDKRNLITLCLHHHLLVGHLNNFVSYNTTVSEDATGCFYKKTPAQIKANKIWQAKCKARPKTWHLMSDDEQKAFKSHLDTQFPK